jgi:16S rRNA (adenine1518-N6/adenine1519-N6)-dimethyltransferase
MARPKKSLGQNFLTSIPARNAIVLGGDIKRSDVILEIGPGKGMLTEGLLATGAHVIALEKDRELIPHLMERFGKMPNFTLVEGDALTYEPKESGYKIIANIPYYITGAILSRYLTHVHQPSRMVVLVQKEVAERIVARDGKHSLLSLSVWAYGVPSNIYKVNKGSFFPIPKVDSSVLLIENISRDKFVSKAHEELFFKVLHAGFAHKRKFLIRNLEAVTNLKMLQNLFGECNIRENARAEDLTLATWLILSRRMLSLFR